MKRLIFELVALCSVLACSKEAFAVVQTAQGLDVKVNVGACLGNSVKIAEAGNSVRALYVLGDNLYVGTGNSVQVYDITKPMEPRLRSECHIEGGSRQITADDRAIYVTTRGRGVYIIDASNLDDIKLITRYDSIELETGIDVAGDVMFVSLRSYGVEFVDITDLKNPRHIFIEKTPESQSVWYSNGYLYSGEWGVGRVSTIDVSDMSDIKTVSCKNLQGFGDGVSVLGNRLFVSTGHNSRNESKTDQKNDGLGHGVEIFDISNPAEPVFVSRCQFDTHYRGGGGDWWTVRPSADGKTLFAVDTDNGFYVVDIKNEKSPKIIGRIFIPNPNNPAVAISYCTSVAVGDGAVYASSEKYGVFAVECKRAKKVARDKGMSPARPEARFAYETSSDSRFKAWFPDDRYQVKSAAPAGEFLVVACSDAGLYVLDSELKTVGRGVTRFAGDVDVRGNKVFAAEGLDGLGIYELSADGSLKEVSRFKDFEYFKLALWVWSVSDDWVVVNDRGAGNVFIHMEKDGGFKVCGKQNGGTTWWDKYLCDRASAEGYVVNSTIGKGITWVKLSDDGAKVGALNKTFLPGGCAVLYKDDSFLVCQKGSSLVARIKPGSNPVEIIERSEKRVYGQIRWDGDTKLVTNSRASKKVMLYDISEYPKMKMLWNEKFLGNPETPVFWKGKAVVPCAYQGLLVEK